MITTHQILWAMLLPAVAAIIATIAAHRGIRRDRRTQPWGPALAIVGAFVLAYYGIVGNLPSPRQPTAQGWIFFLAIAAFVISIIATFPAPGFVIVILSIALLAAEAWLLARPRHAAMEGREFSIWIVSLAVGFI